MQDLVAAFESQFAQKQFSAASVTLKQLLKDYPDDLQLQVLLARFYDATGKPEKAETIYRNLLRSQTQSKLLNQARQGLKAIEDAEIKQRKDRIAKALGILGGESQGLLAVRPIAPEVRDRIVEKFARIFRLDLYSAKFKLPSRNLKILRTGTVAEMQVYAEELNSIDIPARAVSLDAIAKIAVYNIDYFELPSIHQVHAIHNDGAIAFRLDEVKARVEGIIPTFGQVVTVDAKHKLVWKDQILDRVRFCDFHIPERNCILRFHDNHYKFDRGMQLQVKKSLDHLAPTVQERWVALMQWVEQSFPEVPVHNDFTPFADMAMAYSETLKEIEHHIDLLRHKPSLWDNCFQLFSGMIFLDR
ncbi:tetratricopeptide repeat protein [Tumidithrix elongata RA019]|uniref:Tetratricopeptide repeat protein n=1 Tax=Tumidithrix elongata BACA0141 TaxID=2716417 RepID=A0AAW9Q2Q6_9CYAN|nr:tetratricopeptide repeat protein [Tumidithrix elongata RA019]